MTISVFSTNDHSVVCYHARFVFVGNFKKAVTIPATKFCVIYSLWILSCISYRISFIQMILTVWLSFVVTSHCIRCYVLRMRGGNALDWFHCFVELWMQTARTLRCGGDRVCWKGLGEQTLCDMCVIMHITRIQYSWLRCDEVAMFTQP